MTIDFVTSLHPMYNDANQDFQSYDVFFKFDFAAAVLRLNPVMHICEVTSHSLWSRYGRHFVGIKRYNVRS